MIITIKITLINECGMWIDYRAITVNKCTGEKMVNQIQNHFYFYFLKPQ